MSTYQSRVNAAARIQAETGIRVEAMHPAGSVIHSYIVDGTGAASASEARRMARRIDDQQRMEFDQKPRWTNRQKGGAL